MRSIPNTPQARYGRSNILRRPANRKEIDMAKKKAAVKIAAKKKPVVKK
jgi:hypothetical protein